MRDDCMPTKESAECCLEDEIPSKWVAIVVLYGERRKHLYEHHDHRPHFFPTERDARKWAEDHCRFDQKANVLILRADSIVRAKPVEFETIAA